MFVLVPVASLLSVGQLRDPRAEEKGRDHGKIGVRALAIFVSLVVGWGWRGVKLGRAALEKATLKMILPAGAAARWVEEKEG